MKDEAEQVHGAPQAWATEVMPGADASTHPTSADGTARPLEPVQHDPADVISVFMTAHESARVRNAQARRDAAARARGRSQPS